jgi:hypothetical protein
MHARDGAGDLGMQVHRADRRHRAIRLQHHGHVLPLGYRNRDRGWPLLAGPAGLAGSALWWVMFQPTAPAPATAAIRMARKIFSLFDRFFGRNSGR